MEALTCVTARPRLAAHHDDELAWDTGRFLAEHVTSCEDCAAEAGILAGIRDALRSATPRPATAEKLASFTDGVVSRLLAEREQSLRARIGRLFEDMHLIWAGVAATAGATACVLAVAGLTYFGTAERSDSLFSILAALESPGSNVNPVRPGRGVPLPRVSLDASVPEMLIPRPPDEAELIVALSGVVTREGRITGLEVLLANEEGRIRIVELVRAARNARFEPARVAGAPVAVNLVWLVAHTTVRGYARG